ncbi:hypothetical protein [Aequorivita sp. CIP111184]|uniref:hypothetical protein n=1 Tax=Aequorivita sp. CIP111184 TaxID=2211356 RepID=UPI000DBBBBFD|nr:hypothetical protein [Aequorivita sp. CIP111184]SRX54174.1 hypothetical protein AEQU1_01179 [Aequorivita sp. CIP111184]
MKNEENPATTCPHIGQLVRDRIKARRISKAALARNANVSPQNLHRWLSHQSLQLSVIWELSIAMKHNFLQDLAAQLPPTFTTNAPDPTLPLKERILALEEENKLLHAKVETLMAVVGK